MFHFFKKKKKEEVKVVEETTVKNNFNGYARGMYCAACGYMVVDEGSAALPLEGFAKCPSCGADLKNGWFQIGNDGSFTLTEKPEDAVSVKRKMKSGGHYRVRKRGPVRLRHHDGVRKTRAVR